MGLFVYNKAMYWFVYVLISLKDKQFYIGSSNDLKTRLYQHNHKGNKSTANRAPFKLLYFEGHRSKTDAIRRETYFKTTKGKVTLRAMIRDGLGEFLDQLA